MKVSMMHLQNCVKVGTFCDEFLPLLSVPFVIVFFKMCIPQHTFQSSGASFTILFALSSKSSTSIFQCFKRSVVKKV